MPDAPESRHALTELLSAHLDGRAETNEAASLTAHLASCARCADEVAELAAVRDLLRRLPVVEPPRSFALSSEVAPPEPARIIRLPRLATITRAAAAVAAVFFVLFFIADMAGLGETRTLLVTGALSPDALTTSSAPVPALAAAPAAQRVPTAAAQVPAAAEAAPPSGGASATGQPDGAGRAQAGPGQATAAGGAAADATVSLPTPVLRPPPRPAVEVPSADSAGTSTASRQVGAQGESDGIAGAGRARLGAMANTVNQLAGSPSPLRWSWIWTGLLALVLALGAVIVGRRGGP